MAPKIIKITRKLEKNRRKKREELLDVLLKKEIQNQSFKGKKHKKNMFIIVKERCLLFERIIRYFFISIFLKK
jgi:hypothetical protein